jgi:CheY-like chemotaxis protein
MKRTPKILIIDDEHTLLRLSQILLQKKGCQVSVAISAKEGRSQLLGGARFDIIVLDLMMPEENGFDFLKWKDTQPDDIRKIPVIINTAKNLAQDERDFLDSRCSRIMNKGVDFTEKLVSEVTFLTGSI